MSQGVKRYETRGAEFIRLPGVDGYRGPLAIHAAKKKFKPLDYPVLCRQLSIDGLQLPDGLVYGAALCVVDLIGIQRTENVRRNLSSRELMYGDYSDGRYAMESANLRKLASPELLTGHQGLFYWDVPEALSNMLSLQRCDGQIDVPACYCHKKNGKPAHSTHCSALRKRIGAAANKKSRCPNAGMEWKMRGLSTITVRLCSQCYHAAKKAQHNATFQ